MKNIEHGFKIFNIFEKIEYAKTLLESDQQCIRYSIIHENAFKALGQICIFYLREMHFNTVTNHYHIFIVRVMDNITNILNYSNFTNDIYNKKEYNSSNYSNCSIDRDNIIDSDCVVGCTVGVSLLMTVVLSLMIFFLQ